MSMRGKYRYFTKKYNRFKADKNRNYKADKKLLNICILWNVNKLYNLLLNTNYDKIKKRGGRDS